MPKHRNHQPPGFRLKQWIKANNLTQREMAARLGISDPHMSSIIHGKESPGFTLAVRIEAVTGIPPRDFAQVA